MKRWAALACGLVVGVVSIGVAPDEARADDDTWYDRYVAMDAAVGDTYYRSADGAQLAWNESYVLDSYVDVYGLSRDRRWLDKAVTHIDGMIADADDADGDGYRGWQTARYSPVEIDNGGMETGAQGDSTLPADWLRFQTTSANAFRTTDRRAGAYAARIDSDGQLWRKLYQPVNTYHPNTVYQLRFWSRTNGSAAGGQAYLYDATAKQVLCSTDVTATVWTYHSLDCRTPSVAGHTLQVWIGHRDYRVAGGQAYFDDVALSGRFPYLVHDGMIGSSIARFARLVEQTPELHESYRAKAVSYRTFLESEVVPRWESSSYIGNTWYALTSTTGTYKQSLKIDAFSHKRNWSILPYNQSLAFSNMLLILHEINGNAAYLDRARLNGQYFKNALTLSGDAYTWPYSYSSAQPEDVSHANIDVGAARELHRRGIVFTPTDMQRFTNTLTNTLWNGSLTAPKVRKFVDGTGDDSFSKYLVEWTAYAQWAKAIAPIVSEQYRHSTVNHGYDMLALARIMKWDRTKLVNQGFELATSFDTTQPAQWTRAGSTATTAFRDSANTHTGQYGLTIRSTGGAPQGVFQSWEGWSPATSYTLTFSGRSSGGAAGGRVVVTNVTTGAVLAALTFTDQDWTGHTLTFQSPDTATQTVRVSIGNADPTVAGAAHVDDIRIRVTGEPW
ncbi:hypothetical protein GCM10029963_76350 [Micromonospora andamanensis]|uniref:hypothetical protein n=1 Tax=Micromonospora andamanensis TaxID=1287068 RepID=UPI00194F42CF|nr:hypothetical protein [Micromonospora andamanensis]GIJ42159.1 hypothetical protein Vwe01_54840 [Micromonospora andamanensis]